MRILMLAHRIPYPPHTGDKTRAFHVARYLAGRHDLTLAFLVDERADLAGLAPLREMTDRVEFGRLWKPWSLLKGVVSLGLGNAMSPAFFHSGGLARRLARLHSEHPYDVIYASSTPVAQYVRELGAPVVMDFVDVDSDKWRQYGDHRRPPFSWLYRAEAGRLQRCEGDIARWASSCLLATSVEEALLRSFAPWAHTTVIPNGIDLSYYAPITGDPGRPAVMFTGAMDYLPNIDAVCHFSAEILPLVRREIPETKFYIVGLNPSPAVLRLADLPGVTVTGAVPDVRPYYARAAVAVAPVRIGRGVQNKVLQGMAMGLPVVASSVASRGIEAEPGRHLYVADEPAAVASHVVRLLRDPGERRVMGRNARGFVEANHAWERSLSRLEPLLARAAGHHAEPHQRPTVTAPAASGATPRGGRS